MSAATEPADGAQLGRLTRLLPYAVLAAAVCLFASELMTLFEFRSQGGIAQCVLGAGDRHSNAQMVVAVFAVIALVVAIYSGSRPAAVAVGVMGGLALLIFLLADLRFANTVGTLGDSCAATPGQSVDANAIPKGGFYLELFGALALTITGVALATLTSEQLVSLRPSRRARPTDPRRPSPRSKEPSSHTDDDGRLSRLTRRPRARQRG